MMFLFRSFVVLSMLGLGSIAQASTPRMTFQDTDPVAIVACQYCPHGNISCRKCARSAEEANFFMIENPTNDTLSVSDEVKRPPLLSDCTYPTENGCPDGQQCVRVNSWLMHCMR